MLKFYKFIGIIGIFSAFSLEAGRYFCKSTNDDRLVITYDLQTHVPRAQYSFVPTGAEEVQAPLDGSQSYSVQAIGNMLSSMIETEGKSILIRFEAANNFDEMRCRASRDRFGMPIMAPRCHKTATMNSTDQSGMTTSISFICEYLADTHS